jgi:hypothetical protein
MISPPVFSTCFASATLKSLLGSSPMRLYIFGEAEQNTQRPYAVWQLIGGSPDNYLGRAPDVDRFSVQFDVYAETAASARDVAAAIRSTIETTANVVNYSLEARDPETRLYRYSFGADWIVRR